MWRGRVEPALEIDRGIAERGAGLGSRGAHRAGEIRRIGDRAHALAAAAGDRLDQQRIADRVGDPRRSSASATSAASGVVGARHDRHAGAHRRRARGGLAAHQRDRLGRRADERQPGVAHGGGEVLVLGEEAVAGMDGVGARRAAPRR